MQAVKPTGIGNLKWFMGFTEADVVFVAEEKVTKDKVDATAGKVDGLGERLGVVEERQRRQESEIKEVVERLRKVEQGEKPRTDCLGTPPPGLRVTCFGNSNTDNGSSSKTAT